MSKVHEVTHNSQLPSHHPLKRVSLALRVWLALLAAVMFWNAVVANEILLNDPMKAVPFVVLGIVALVWLTHPWSGRVTIWCSALLSVGLVMRAVEIAMFGAEVYDAREQATVSSIWVLIAATALVFGFLNLVAISRRAADVQVWGPR